MPQRRVRVLPLLFHLRFGGRVAPIPLRNFVHIVDLSADVCVLLRG